MKHALTLLTALLLAPLGSLHAAAPASGLDPSAVRVERDVAYLSPERTVYSKPAKLVAADPKSL